MKNILSVILILFSNYCFSQKNEFEVPTSDFEIVKLTKSQFIYYNQKGVNFIAYEIEGEIKNVSGVTIIKSILSSTLKMEFGTSVVYLSEIDSANGKSTGGFDTKVSSSNPFKPNQIKKFHLILIGLDPAYKENKSSGSFRIRIVAEALFDYKIADFIIFNDTTEQDITDKWELFRLDKVQDK